MVRESAERVKIRVEKNTGNIILRMRSCWITVLEQENERS